MKLYIAPEFARTLETFEPRYQNMTKIVVKFIEDHTREEIFNHAIFKVRQTMENSLYTIVFRDLQFFASLQRDKRGEYMILVDLQVV